jgi:hypothetical protein
MEFRDYEVFARFMARWTPAERARLQEIEARHYPNESVDGLRAFGERLWGNDWLNATQYDDDDLLRCSARGEHHVTCEHEQELPTSWFQASNGAKRYWTSLSGEFAAV